MIQKKNGIGYIMQYELTDRICDNYCRKSCHFPGDDADTFDCPFEPFYWYSFFRLNEEERCFLVYFDMLEDGISSIRWAMRDKLVIEAMEGKFRFKNRTGKISLS